MLFSFEKGKFYSNKSEDDIAKTLYNEAIDICSKLNFYYTKAQLLISKSFIYRKRGDFKSPINYLNESLQICNDNEFN